MRQKFARSCPLPHDRRRRVTSFTTFYFPLGVPPVPVLPVPVVPVPVLPAPVPPVPVPVWPEFPPALVPAPVDDEDDRIDDDTPL